MTVVQLLLAILVIVVIGIAAHWIIGKFLGEPMRPIAYTVVGIVLLILLFAMVLPDIGGYQLWRR